MTPDVLSQHLKESIGLADRYTLLALSSAAAFVALSLPNPTGDTGEAINWQLLGLPVTATPQVALVALYLAYVGCSVLADNLVIHVRELADRIDDQERVRAILTYPTILTVSPIGRLFGTVLAAALVLFGLVKAHLQGVYQMPVAAWWFAYVFALSGVLVYLRVQLSLVPRLYPEPTRPRPDL